MTLENIKLWLALIWTTFEVKLLVCEDHPILEGVSKEKPVTPWGWYRILSNSDTVLKSAPGSHILGVCKKGNTKYRLVSKRAYTKPEVLLSEVLKQIDHEERLFRSFSPITQKNIRAI